MLPVPSRCRGCGIVSWRQRAGLLGTGLLQQHLLVLLFGFKRFSSHFLPPEVWLYSACAHKQRWEAVRIQAGFLFFSPHALLVVFPRPNCLSLLASLPARRSNHPWLCPLPRSPCLYPITTVGLFVSAFPCSRTPACSPSGGGRVAFKALGWAGRPPARGGAEGT